MSQTNDILLGDMVSIRDVSTFDYGTIDNGNEGRLLDSSDGYDSDDAIVLEEELEKIQVLLRGCEEIALEIPKDKPKCKFCKSHRKFEKQAVEEARRKKANELEDVDKEHFIPLVIPLESKGKKSFCTMREIKIVSKRTYDGDTTSN